MSSIKRKRDPEYQYEDPRKSVENPEPPQNQGMTSHSSQGPSSWAASNDHADSLLAQAKKSGLLLPTGSGVPPLFPPISGPFPPNILQVPTTDGVNPHRIHSQQGMDQRRQQQRNVQHSNDSKRRKLNTNIVPKKGDQQNRSKFAPKSRPPPKKGQKLPAKASVDDKYVERLIAEALSTPSGRDVPSSDSIPKFPSIPKPENYPPPLPPIDNKALEQQCFTHRSYIHDPLNKDSTSSLLHYERLEFLGDSYMNYCVTKILYNRLPNIREGELTRFRSQIISNDNIRHYAMMYGFSERIRLSIGAEKDDVREAGKKIADIFEAYIGGIISDQPETGEQTVFKWLSEVIAPQVDEAEKVAKAILNVNRNAKQELYVLLDAEKAPAPAYIVTREGSTNTDFEVACLVQGREMGRGRGKNKNEAGIRAAMQALERLRASTQKHKPSIESDAQASDVENKNGSGEAVNGKSQNQGGKYSDELSSAGGSSSSKSLSEGEIDVGSDYSSHNDSRQRDS